MPPLLATALTVTGIFILFWRDRKSNDETSRALWLPFWWFLISSSRFVHEWLNIFGIPVPGGSLEDGSPIDRLFYLTLIIAGLVVLQRRRIQLLELSRNNVAIALFLGYCFISVYWSDYPLISLKRWIKVLGHPIMALIVLTEVRPQEAFTRLLLRSGFVLVPVSILFIKYYPELGRGFSEWTGQGYNTGITTDKNLLGINCLVLGYFYVWHFLQVWKSARSPKRTKDLLILGVFLYMNSWLLLAANSKTPLVSLLIGTALLLSLEYRSFRRHIGLKLASIVVIVATMEMVFDLYASVLALLGREATLTDRTDLWSDLLETEINPVIGTGFESFWMGERLARMWELWSFKPNQAHNGYLETYLNLGLLGVAILLLLLLSIYRKATRDIVTHFTWGSFRLGFLVIIMLYNWTEAAFKATHPIFFMVYVIALDIHRSPSACSSPTGNTQPVENPPVPPTFTAQTTPFT